MIGKNEDYIDIIEDIREECETFGKLLQVIIPRRGAGIVLSRKSSHKFISLHHYFFFF